MDTRTALFLWAHKSLGHSGTLAHAVTTPSHGSPLPCSYTLPLVYHEPLTERLFPGFLQCRCGDGGVQGPVPPTCHPRPRILSRGRHRPWVPARTCPRQPPAPRFTCVPAASLPLPRPHTAPADSAMVQAAFTRAPSSGQPLGSCGYWALAGGCCIRQF